jgi:hypothetical protein
VGCSRIVELTGMSHSNIDRVILEIWGKKIVEKPEKLWAKSGGRKKVELKDQEIIMDKNTADDTMSFLIWS